MLNNVTQRSLACLLLLFLVLEYLNKLAHFRLERCLWTPNHHSITRTTQPSSHQVSDTQMTTTLNVPYMNINQISCHHFGIDPEGSGSGSGE